MHAGVALRAGFALALLLLLGACSSNNNNSKANNTSGKAGTAAASYGTITIDAGKPIIIGISTALSGGVASLGKPIAQGAQLAVAQKGTIKGHPVQADAQDDTCNAQGSVAAATKLVSEAGLAGVVGAMCSGGCVPSEQIYNDKHIPAISPSCTAPNVTTQGFDNIMRTIPNDSLQGAGQAKFAKEELKALKTFVVNDQSIYAKALQDIFKKSYADNDHKIVGEETIKVGDTDFSALVSKIQAANPDLISFYGFVPEGTLLVQQLRKAGVKTTFLVDEGVKEPDDYIKKAQGAAEGTYVSNGSAGTTDAETKFAADYKAKYSADPGIFADTSYDAANLLMTTIESVAKDQGGKLVIDKKALIDALRKANFQGITGTINFDANGDRKGGSTIISQVKGDAFAQVKEYKQ
jgi:branched-chain amino acid transport system substrate-binding protein